MRFFIRIMMVLVCVSVQWALANSIQCRPFIAQPAPAANELLAARAMVINQTTGRCYVLDAGLRRILTFAGDGASSTAKSFDALGVYELAMPEEPLLPQPALAVAEKSAYLLDIDRGTRSVKVIPVDGGGTRRTVALPEGAKYAAVTLDLHGRVLVAYVTIRGPRLALVLAREEPKAEFDELVAEEGFWDAQTKNLAITGLALAPDGRLAIGIAQGGDANSRFQRSWLVQGRVENSSLKGDLRISQKFVLYDGQGKVYDRYRLPVAHGVIEKPCVPLFTSLAFGPGPDLLMTGGHPVDPYLRIIDPKGIRFATPYVAPGGQCCAGLVGENADRFLALARNGGAVEMFDSMGRLVGRVGIEVPCTLDEVVALAADSGGVYAATRQAGGLRLVRVNTEGTPCWAQDLLPPRSMKEAQPVLAAPGADRVIVGWRLPGVAGLSWATTVMADGTPGLPLWREVSLSRLAGPRPQDVTPMLVGGDGLLYCSRVTDRGTVVQSFTALGAPAKTYAAVLGVTLVAEDGSLAWAHMREQDLIMTRYTAQGVERGWKRIPRPTEHAALWPVRTADAFGWLTSTQTLLRFDETMTVIAEHELIAPDGARITNPVTVTGDGAKRIYVAVLGKILVADME